MSRFRTLVALIPLLAACPSDGSAPQIRDLTVDPSEVPAGEPSQVDGTFDFTDEDGDISEVEITLTVSGVAESMTVELQGAGGMTSGRAAFRLLLTPPAPGEAPLSITAIDDNGNRSNELATTLTFTESTTEPPPESQPPHLDAWVTL